MVNTGQVRKVAITGLLTAAIALCTGLLSGMSIRGWLVYGLATSLVLWVGGAVSGQILLARLLDRGHEDWTEVLAYLRQLLWIIPRFYVPLGFVAVACGLGLVYVADAPSTQLAVIVPLALYVLTAVAGAAISAPGYVRLIRTAERRLHPAPSDDRSPAGENSTGVSAADLRARLIPLAWLNRIELALVIGVGFVLLAGVA